VKNHTGDLNSTGEKTFFVGEERFRGIFDSIFDGIFIHDSVTGALLDVNSRACAMWGFTKEEILGMQADEIGPPLGHANARDWIIKASQEPEVFEWLCTDRNGREFWTEISMRSEVIDQKKYGIIAVRDIDSRKEEELKRHAVSANLEALFRAINDSICLLDPNGTILQANHSMARQLNRPMEEIVGKKCFELMHNACCFIQNCPMQRMLVSGTRESLELCKGNRWFNITTDPVFNDKGEISGAVHIVRDISERKHLAMEREQLLTEIQKAHSEIKTLHGLLPICASCKKIRDAEGYWIQFESFIETRSDAQFSHGICPDCAEKLYPDFCRGKMREEGF